MVSKEGNISSKLKEVKVDKGKFVNLQRGSIEKDYIVGEVVGSGAFATVRKVTHKPTGQARALKVIKKQRDSEQDKMYLEVDILKTLVHPNILTIYEFYEDKKSFYIITEQCEGGELFDQIVDKDFLTEVEAAKIMHQLLSAINYSHKRLIVHRDLKPENILLDVKNDSVIKIIDWGNARFFDPNKKMTKASGTPYYIAPEVLNGKYNEKCDVWSIGVIMYILLCGYPPFNGDDDNEVLAQVAQGEVVFPDEEWACVSKEAKDFIGVMLNKNYKKRFSAEDCLKHDWFEKTLNLKEKSKNIPINCLNNMKKFRAERKLQQAALTYMVNYLLSKEEKNEMLEQFQKFDKNNDGVLSREEIHEGFKSILGEVEAKTEVERIMNEIDIDNDGSINYNEFVIAATNRQKVFNKDKLEATFKTFDSDGNGFISKEEITSLFSGIGGNSGDANEIINEIVKQVDENGDGQISLTEFKTMILQMLE